MIKEGGWSKETKSYCISIPFLAKVLHKSWLLKSSASLWTKWSYWEGPHNHTRGDKDLEDILLEARAAQHINNDNSFQFNF